MKTIKQNHFVSATPEEVFLAITNPLTIELWSGYPAQMEAKEGYEFSLFDGDISGRNIKIVDNIEIVQEWYFGDNAEESIVTIELKAANNGTKVEVTHTNIPDDDYEDFEEGWKEYYWGAIKKYFK